MDRKRADRAVKETARSCFLAPGPATRKPKTRPNQREKPKTALTAARGFCKLRKSWSKVRFRSETKPPRRRSAPGPENQIPIPTGDHATAAKPNPKTRRFFEEVIMFEKLATRPDQRPIVREGACPRRRRGARHCPARAGGRGVDQGNARLGRRDRFFVGDRIRPGFVRTSARGIGQALYHAGPSHL